MAVRSIEEIARQFPENGMKLLLENPRNVRDLLTMTGSDLVELIDMDRMRLIQTTFVQRDYRHIESDVVLVAPFRRRGRGKQNLLVYVLIEHQSEPDRLMPLRLLEYVVQVFNYQARQWSKKHRSFARIRLQPVLPVVFYTGTRRWDTVGRLIDLVEAGRAFESVTPLMEPLFINLPQIEAATLESSGGFFGWVLRLVQERKSRPKEFRGLLHRVVEHLETMSSKERLRWLELLSYIVALVYHVRRPSERPNLEKAIESSVRADEHRQELSKMGRTIAEELKEEGARTARQQTLVRLLEKRFGELPEEVVSAIGAAESVEQLDRWLDQVVMSEQLADIDFGV